MAEHGGRFYVLALPRPLSPNGIVRRFGQGAVAAAAQRTVPRALYNKSSRLIAEAKYGYQSFSHFIQTEVTRDAWLLETHQVDSVEWHFYISAMSETGGLSDSLFNALGEAGIIVIYHF